MYSNNLLLKDHRNDEQYVSMEISKFRERGNIHCIILTLSQDLKFAVSINCDSSLHVAPMSKKWEKILKEKDCRIF